MLYHSDLVTADRRCTKKSTSTVHARSEAQKMVQTCVKTRPLLCMQAYKKTMWLSKNAMVTLWPLMTFSRCTHLRPELPWRTAAAPVPGGWRGRWGCSWWELYQRDAAVSVRLASDLQCQSHSSVETALHSTTPGLRSPTQHIHKRVTIICKCKSIGQCTVKKNYW